MIYTVAEWPRQLDSDLKFDPCSVFPLKPLNEIFVSRWMLYAWFAINLYLYSRQYHLATLAGANTNWMVPTAISCFTSDTELVTDFYMHADVG